MTDPSLLHGIWIIDESRSRQMLQSIQPDCSQEEMESSVKDVSRIVYEFGPGYFQATKAGDADRINAEFLGCSLEGDCLRVEVRYRDISFCETWDFRYQGGFITVNEWWVMKRK